MNDISHAFPNPQYLGCKYRHLDWIGHYIPGGVSKVADGFAGSQSVSYFMKGKGYEVYANDFMNYSNQIGKALIENSSDRLSDDDVQMLFSGNSNPEYYNLIETEFSDLFFSREDARLIDAFRSNVDRPVCGWDGQQVFVRPSKELYQQADWAICSHKIPDDSADNHH